MTLDNFTAPSLQADTSGNKENMNCRPVNGQVKSTTACPLRWGKWLAMVRRDSSQLLRFSHGKGDMQSLDMDSIGYENKAFIAN
ncbi:hypothetical protein N7517_007942 [Penicillium concentricum]|uniref:Uncharacterized protein n=1 Tax=Penicillium concentricum TaxID=293559 RepID=A0A9W9RRI4_9EURO|nr:uncharacterized protein N7517_007942 [Penicillium concentricum]KAJ5365056.1 hypothetical protein N7517_007942 [Penicillium concentricum]